MKSRWLLVLAGILGLVLSASLSVPVATAAPPSIKLVIGGTGATTWAIGPVAPGDNGTKSVTLGNTGFNSGVVTIWISDIVNGEGANPQSETGNTAEPGELGNYILLNVSGTNLSTDFIMPAKMSNFPQSDNDTRNIYLNPLKAFGTVNLQWDWRLPLETGDDIQGDNISFTINYMLEEIPPPPSPSLPPPSSSGGGTPQANTSVDITTTNPSGAVVGSTGSYTLSATNTGATVLNGVVVTGYLPEFLNYQSSIPSGTVTGNQITWNLGFLNIGETKEIVVVLAGVKVGTAVITAVMTAREGVSSTYTLNITVLEATVTSLPSLMLPQAPVSTLSPPLPPAEVKAPTDTVTFETLPPVPPALLGTQNGMSRWLIPTILAGISALAFVCYVLVVLIGRRRRWDWIPYILTTNVPKVVPQTEDQRTIYAVKRQKRVAELAGAIAQEMKLSKKLAGKNSFLEARIMAMADTVETVADTVKRSTTSKHSLLVSGLDKALEEIKESGSALYDSEVIKAFVRLADRGEFRFQTHYN